MEDYEKERVTELMSNEQTFLAWLRTGIEVMAFGFVAIKFSLFASQVMGILLVGGGALMTALSYFRFRSTVKQLRKGKFKYNIFLLTAVATAILLISVILMMCLVDAYLETGNTHGNPESEQTKIEKF